MNENFIVAKLNRVFEGEFCPGRIKKQNIGRTCDGMAYISYGEIEYIFDDYSYVATDNSIIFLPKNSRYAMDIQKKSKYICINFELLENDKNRESHIFLDVPHKIKNEFEKALQLWLTESLWKHTEIMSIIYRIYSAGLKSLNKKYTKSWSVYSNIIKYVLESYTEPDFTVQRLADTMKMSECHLRRIFKAHLNTSPSKYINYLRLEKAKSMLEASNYTVSEVALSSGFADAYYFSRVFKKEIGISPGEYRNRMQHYDEYEFR